MKLCPFIFDCLYVELQELVNDCLKPPPEGNGDDISKRDNDLRCMRNTCSAIFLIANAVYVALIIALESFAEQIGIPWLPSVCSESEPKIQPLGFVFLGLFGLIMVIQTLGMVVHRVGTFIHTMSITDLRCGSSKQNTEELWREQRQQFAAATRRRFTSAVVPNIVGGGEESDSDDDEFYVQPVNRPSRMYRPSVLPPISGGNTRNVSHVAAANENASTEDSDIPHRSRRRSVRFVSDENDE